jgi:hypothetical protein
LVTFIRKKDKKKGWYTYFWTFDSEKAFLLIKKIILKEIDQLQHELSSRQVKRFYKSPGLNIEYSEEKALEYDFICPETGEVMELKDNSAEIKEINLQISRLQKKLELIDVELKLIDGKKEKSAERKRKKEEKEKVEKKKLSRENAAKKRAEKKKLENKDSVKKVAKKAVKKKVAKKTTKKK